MSHQCDQTSNDSDVQLVLYTVDLLLFKVNVLRQCDKRMTDRQTDGQKKNYREFIRDFIMIHVMFKLICEHSLITHVMKYMGYVTIMDIIEYSTVT